MRTFRRVTVTLAALLLFLLSGSGAILAQEANVIVLDSPVRGLAIDPSRERVDLDVVLYNRADDRRVVSFALEDVPEGWNIGLWSRLFDYRITQFVVEPTAADPDRIQQARLRIVPPSGVQPGDYTFSLHVRSVDGSIEYDSATYTVTVAEQPGGDSANVSLRAEIPALQGAPGSTLGFEVIVRNDTGEETSFNLSAQPPAGWQVTFREPFGEQRVIGAVSVANALTQRVRVDVRAPRDVALGEYEIPVTASSNLGEASVVLRANVVGQGQLQASTPTGNLAVRASAGGEDQATVRLNNPGTDTLRDVRLTASAPANWRVEFGIPDNTVTELPAGHQIDIPVTISPPGDAISGDYIVTVRASNPQASTQMDLRVTVTQSTIWGWLGIVLVVLVVGGMIGLFLRLGRR